MCLSYRNSSDACVMATQLWSNPIDKLFHKYDAIALFDERDQK